MKCLITQLQKQIEEIIPDLVKDMQSFGLKRIVPAYCTSGGRCMRWPTSMGTMCWRRRRWECSFRFERVMCDQFGTIMQLAKPDPVAPLLC